MIVYRFKVQCRPEKAEDVRAAMEQVVEPSRRVPGVISFDIARDLLDPSSFVATEVFEDKAALDRQELLPEVAKVMEIMGDALVGPPEATLFYVSSSEPWG